MSADELLDLQHKLDKEHAVEDAAERHLRGLCVPCGKWHAIKGDGKLHIHGKPLPAGTWGKWEMCPGSGQVPMMTEA